MSSFPFSVWTIYRKDMAVWWRNRLTLLASVLPVAGLFLVQAIGTAAVGRNPVALVILDQGPIGTELKQAFHDADVFILYDATPEQAQALFDNIKVAAIVTVPEDFSQRFAAHQTSPLDVRLNNLNLDFSNDIRRAVPDVITQFYAAQGAGSPINVNIHETDLRSRDVELFQFNVVPMIMLLLTINGLVTSGTATAREWETRTVKEMLLAPVPREAIVIAKVLSGFTVTFVVGLVVLGLGAALDWTRPQGVYVLTSVVIIALVALMSTGLGVAIGVAFQRIQPTTATSTLAGFYLFFLAGGISVLAFLPQWLQQVAVFDPLAYGVHALEMAVFYSSSDLLGRDVLVLTLTALVSLGLGFAAMRRQLT